MRRHRILAICGLFLLLLLASPLRVSADGGCDPDGDGEYADFQEFENQRIEELRAIDPMAALDYERAMDDLFVHDDLEAAEDGFRRVLIRVPDSADVNRHLFYIHAEQNSTFQAHRRAVMAINWIHTRTTKPSWPTRSS